jgi:hypothetical protein
MGGPTTMGLTKHDDGPSSHRSAAHCRPNAGHAGRDTTNVIPLPSSLVTETVHLPGVHLIELALAHAPLKRVGRHGSPLPKDRDDSRANSHTWR